jgi:hypothetical protein
MIDPVFGVPLWGVRNRKIASKNRFGKTPSLHCIKREQTESTHNIKRLWDFCIDIIANIVDPSKQ